MINRKGCYAWPTLDFVPFGNHYINTRFNWFNFNSFNFNFNCFNVQIIKSRHVYLRFIRSCSISLWSSANATRKMALTISTARWWEERQDAKVCWLAWKMATWCHSDLSFFMGSSRAVGFRFVRGIAPIIIQSWWQLGISHFKYFKKPSSFFGAKLQDKGFLQGVNLCSFWLRCSVQPIHWVFF